MTTTPSFTTTSGDIFEALGKDIAHAPISESDRVTMLRNLQNLRNQKINLLITGATGVGKSSTINALFETEVAKVGTSPNPETMDISKYELGNLVIWDSPGLGDGKEADTRHAKGIISKLNEVDSKQAPLIDVVLVLVEAGSRDLGTTFELINNIIIPNLGPNTDRLIVALNQADQAMKGRNWDRQHNKPMPALCEFLDTQIASVARRIKESTGVGVTPMYFSAGYKDAQESQKPYNLSKLLYHIVKHTPSEKRVAYVDTISRDPEMWKCDDEVKEYTKEVQATLWESVTSAASKGASIGRDIGRVFGGVGETIGAVVGGFVGGVCGAIGSLFGW